MTRRGPGTLSAPACALRADPHVVAVELSGAVPGLSTMELAGPEAVLQTDQRKLQVFKSTATGLSFEADTSPDLADPRYLVVKRPLRGVASWFENPAYRADTGDYVVTSDGKLVGIMVEPGKVFRPHQGQPAELRRDHSAGGRPAVPARRGNVPQAQIAGEISRRVLPMPRRRYFFA